LNCGTSRICKSDNGFEGNTTGYTDNVAYIILNETDSRSLNNLYKQYDMMCASGFDKTLPATAYFIGATLGALFIPPLSDVYGRRKTFLCCCFVSIFMFLIQLVVPYDNTTKYVGSFYAIGASMFINGIASASRKSIGFCYIVELSPTKFRAALGTAWNTSELSLTNIYITTYFWFISSNWKGTAYIGEFLVCISFIMIWAFVPESPKWLFVKKRYSDLRAVMIYMARTNGVNLD
jgi:MFS family permease